MSFGYDYWMEELLASANRHTYLIELRKNGGKWFFLNLSAKTENLTQVLWTPSFRQAHMFFSEQSVEEFKAAHISPRKVSIVRMQGLQTLLTF